MAGYRSDLPEGGVIKLWKQTGRSYLKKKDRKTGSKKVLYIADFLPDLTKGKIYEVLDEDQDTYSVVDDENAGIYKYGRHCFEEVELENG